MRVRRVPAESGTCAADLCGELVIEGASYEGKTCMRGFCRAHSRERELELFARNAIGGTAEVLTLSDYERGPDGRVQRRE